MATINYLKFGLDKDEAKKNAQAIMDAASLDMEGDGIVAILPVGKLYRIRTKEKINDEQNTEVMVHFSKC